MGAAQARSRIKNRGSRRAVLPTEVRAMNENVKIDYDTAEKVMDLDGSKVYVKTIGDKTRADGVQRVCAAFDTYADGPELTRRRRRSMKIMMIPGFSWAKSVGPKLPKLPDGSCPARRPRAKLCDGAEHCTVTPRRPGARRRTSATRPKAPARSSSRTGRRRL